MTLVSTRSLSSLGSSKKRPDSYSVSSSSSKFKLIDSASFIPDSPEFNLVHELQENRELYTGIESSQLALYNFPEYLLTNIDRARKKVESLPAPSTASAICACTAYGLSTLTSNPHVQSYIQLGIELSEVQDNGSDALAIQEISSWYRKANISIADPHQQSKPKSCYWFSEPVKKSLLSLSSQLGCSASPLCIMCVTITLSSQPTTLVQHRDMMLQGIEIFLRKLEIRVSVAKALLTTLREY